MPPCGPIRRSGNRIVPVPWEGRMFDYQRRDEMPIPVQGEVDWLALEGRRPYWRGVFTELTCQR